jgi:hypothetical protein
VLDIISDITKAIIMGLGAIVFVALLLKAFLSFSEWKQKIKEHIANKKLEEMDRIFDKLVKKYGEDRALQFLEFYSQYYSEEECIKRLKRLCY